MDVIDLIKTLEETAAELSEHINNSADRFVATNDVKQAIVALQTAIHEARKVFEYTRAQIDV